jgi:capsular polysaccharide biosynthesis protein
MFLERPSAAQRCGANRRGRTGVVAEGDRREGATVTEQVLDVKGALRVIRKFWRVVAAFLVAGVLAAAAYTVYGLPKYSATALVLLPTPNSSQSATSPTARNVTTDAHIATSAAVLVPAGHEAGTSPSLTSLQHRVTAASAATGVLRITATGSSARSAETLVNAVAAQLVTFVATSGATASSSIVTGLRAESKQLGTQLSDVQLELTAAKSEVAADTATTAAGAAAAKLVSRLESQQQSLVLQLNSVKSQISQAELEQVAANEGTQVLQRATTATPPALTALVLPIALGAFGGLVVGSIAVLAWHRKNPKLHTRDAMAGALGAPVLASLDVDKRQSTAQWQYLLEQYEPSALERWTVRRFLREVGGGEEEPSQLEVLALAGDASAMALAAHVALAMAASGRQTSFAVSADNEHAASLRALCARYVHEERAPRPRLEVGEGRAAQRPDAPDISVTVRVVEPARAASVPARPPGSATVLAVSSGFASAEELAAVAIGAADSGSALTGLLVANPLSGDPTVGRFAGSAPAPRHASRRNDPSAAVPARRTVR